MVLVFSWRTSHRVYSVISGIGGIATNKQICNWLPIALLASFVLIVFIAYYTNNLLYSVAFRIFNYGVVWYTFNGVLCKN